MPAPPIDLSDLDPFSPSSSRTVSPHPNGDLFPTSPHFPSSSTTSTSTAAARVPAAKQDVLPQAVSGGNDPLLVGGDLLGGLSLAPAPAARATSTSSTTAAAAGAAAGLGAALGGRAVRAQEQRQSHILADLNREPFTAEPSSTSSSSPFSSGPSSSSFARHPPPQPHPHAPFSPPRRLSTLMSPSSPTSSFAPSSPPAESSALSDPFHPDLEACLRGDEGGGRGGAAGRMREASGEWERGCGVGGAAAAAAGGAGGAGSAAVAAAADADASWGDFVEAPPTPPRPLHHPSSPPVPIKNARNGSATRSKPSPAPSSTAASSSSHAAAHRASTYPDPSLLSVRASTSTSTSKPTSTSSSSSSAPNRSASTTPIGGRGGGGGGGGGGGFDPAAQAIRLTGVRPGVVKVLDEDVAEGIRPSLPPRLRLSPRWTLLYSLDQHGISLSTLFSQLEKGLKERDGGFVLVIRTERDEVLGAYVSEALRRPGREEVRGKERWVGDGTCFLFSTRPFPPSDPRLGLTVKPFPPTFRNTFFAHASASSGSSEAFLAFGGGNDGVFGLWVDGAMERGWTGRCETYGNEPLVRGSGGGEGEGGEEKGKFEIVGLECWAVGT
ncbi:hypothetical protein JCM6882_006041 [Rhodosporidiobolus microsporus]